MPFFGKGRHWYLQHPVQQPFSLCTSDDIISKRLIALYSQQELRHEYLLRIQVFQFITEGFS